MVLERDFLQLLNLSPQSTTCLQLLNTVGNLMLFCWTLAKLLIEFSHHHLSAKLNYYGIRGSTLSWINAFLSNRFQAVSVNGRHSTWVEVTSGVPQGSVLGPALFLLYINDIQDHITSRIRLFADDSIVYREIKQSGRS